MNTPIHFFFVLLRSLPVALFASLPVTVFAGLLAPAFASAQAAAPEVRVFEVRRLNSDFEPMEGLSFRLANDGTRIQPSQWLATLARQVPEGFLAQLLSVRLTRPPGTDASVWEAVHEHGRRDIRIRVRDIAGDGEAAPTARIELELLRDGDAVWAAAAEETVAPGGTVVVSGRYFEVSRSRYLSWFRDAADLPARERLYEDLRDHSIWLVLAVSRPAEPRDPTPPARVEAPRDPRLLALESSLAPEAAGEVELRLLLDDRGRPAMIEIASTTLPEVSPRILAMASEWRFPEAAGREATLALSVATRPRRPTGPGGPRIE